MRAIKRKEIVEEVKKQLWLAGPLFSVGLLFYSIQAISVMFVGHLGELALSGASLATSFASVTGFNFLVSWVPLSLSIYLSLDSQNNRHTCLIYIYMLAILTCL